MTQRKTAVTVGKDIYWLNKLTALDECLAAHMNQLMDEMQPEWLTESQTVMIPRRNHPIQPVPAS